MQSVYQTPRVCSMSSYICSMKNHGCFLSIDSPGVSMGTGTVFWKTEKPGVPISGSAPESVAPTFLAATGITTPHSQFLRLILGAFDFLSTTSLPLLGSQRRKTRSGATRWTYQALSLRLAEPTYAHAAICPCFELSIFGGRA